MVYLSTRGGGEKSAAEAIVQGIAEDGGLFVPEAFPAVQESELDAYCAMDYRALAKAVMAPYLTGLPVDAMVDAAYGPKFDTPQIAPLHLIRDGLSALELFHGPTLAFKDMALQFLPHLLTASKARTGGGGDVLILVATSGDTGKAALEGFRDVPGTRVLVFYPHGGVSDAQRLQMVTQEGSNVGACAVEGNFDDAQTAVKRIFTDAGFKERLNERGITLSSANSINFGRLAPQIVYYFYAYCTLVRQGTVPLGEAINFCVPTGNFGNILAAYYAWRMGLPVRKLLCASNTNNVLTEFFSEGRYNSRRPFYKSMSCSIDILVSSNLERLLFELGGRKGTGAYMEQLLKSGEYRIDETMRGEAEELFYAAYCTEEETLRAIRATYEEDGYLIDPHTAVARHVYNGYRERTGDRTHTVITATASPFKFAPDVLAALGGRGDDPFICAEALAARTACAVPRAILELRAKPERHTGLRPIEGMKEWILSQL